MRLRTILIWSALALALIVPVVVSATSPLLEWRQPIYIIAGLAGVIALCLALPQPLLAANVLPGISIRRSRLTHRVLGCVLLAAVLIHVIGLWITSPPDVVDVLLFRSPTPFSLWGVIALSAVLLAGLVASLRRRLSVRVWRTTHTALAFVTVVSTVAHALLIEGTMGTVSKAILCVLVVVTTVHAVWKRKLWQMWTFAGK